ncbi:MAG: amidase [Ilumatobacteraceae bacterium]
MDPVQMSAAELSAAIHERTVSCVDVMAAFLDRIDERNPTLNAIVALRDRDELLTEAAARDGELDVGVSHGWMHGFPHAVKDLAETAGLRTTMGSPLLADQVPTFDALHVARIRAAGAIIIGKTNVPEFGLGSNTYNPVYGLTRNPHDPSRVAGGSSGGAAVALATRMVPVADGSDYMGSLRNPAGWNNIVGFRPSQGRVPSFPARDAYTGQLATDGPMGRTVLDVALLLGTQAGFDRRAPLSTPGRLDGFADAATARRSLDGDLTGVRVGWLADLDGHLATEVGILEVCGEALSRMESAGANVVPVTLGFDHDRLWEAWLAWRHAAVATTLGPLLASDRTASQLKPEARWEAERGLSMSAMDLKRAAIARTEYVVAIGSLLDTVDVLALPTAQMWPFSADVTWPDRIGDRRMDTYHRWMECTLHATFAGLPAVSMPAGFSAAGLPAGIQLIGQPHGDVDVLRVAAAYERTIEHLAVGTA